MIVLIKNGHPIGDTLIIGDCFSYLGQLVRQQIDEIVVHNIQDGVYMTFHADGLEAPIDEF